MIGRNDDCWCGSKKKWKKCHFPQENAQGKILNIREEYLKKHQIRIKNKTQIEGIRRSCALASEILDKTCQQVRAGITTKELDEFARQLYKQTGAIPATLNYGHPPFPGTICTSINEVICHGIPDGTVLKEGDIVNIDVTTILNGYFGDCSRMVTVGSVNQEKQLVVDVAYESLMRSIQPLKPGVPVSLIGDIIEDYANSKGCSVVNQFVAHGVGLQFHEGPQIPHNKNSIHIPLVSGMTFTIEPMINAGKREAVIDDIDQWTARTIDGKASAQWEHTILITDDGHEILTTWKR